MAAPDNGASAVGPFETQDLAIAAYLVHRGAQLASVVPIGHGMSRFVFHDSRVPEFCVTFPASVEGRWDIYVRTLRKIMSHEWPLLSDADSGWSTTSLSLAAFVLTEGGELVSVRSYQEGRRVRHRFFFGGDRRVFKDVRKRFEASPIYDFDDAVLHLKQASQQGVPVHRG